MKILSHPIHCFSLLAWETDIRDPGKDLSTHAHQKFSSDQCELEHTVLGKVFHLVLSMIHATVLATRKVIPQASYPRYTSSKLQGSCGTIVIVGVLKAVSIDYTINLDHKQC